MTRTKTTSIARICPTCRAPNTVIVMTIEFRPSWKMNCSRCGHPIVEHHGSEGSRALEVARAVPPPSLPGVAGLPGEAAAARDKAARDKHPPGTGWRRAWRRCTALNLAVGAACGALLTALLLETDAVEFAPGNAGPGPYEVSLTAAIGPDSVPPPESPRQSDEDWQFAAAGKTEGPAATPAGVNPASGRTTPMAHAPEAAGGLATHPAAASRSGSGAGDGQPAHTMRGARTMLAQAEVAAPADPEAAALAEAELGLSRHQRREVQHRLRLASHDPMLVDGIFGPATRAAIGAWQQAAGLPVTGYLDGDALARLERETETEYQASAAERARDRRRPRPQLASVESPLPPASPASGKCQRNWTGEIAYGQNVRCDFRGLREELRGMREHVVELFSGPERS